MKLLAWIAAVSLLPAQAALADRDETPRIQSPRIGELAARLAANEPHALAAFWRDVERTHAPLIESVPDAPGEMLVTFLVRAAHDANVGVYAPFMAVDDAPIPGRLSRLAGSDVWYRSYQMSSQARFRYYLASPQGHRPDPRAISHDTHRDILYELFTDPLNPKWLPIQDIAEVDRVSYAEGPLAPPEPFVAERHGDRGDKGDRGGKGGRRGTVTTVDFDSRILGNRRKVSIYTPPGYASTVALHDFLLMFDREEYLTSIPTPTVLDNMIADAAIPPVVAVLVGNIDDATRSAELPPNPVFQRFLREELIPWVRARYRITDDPRRSVVAGASYGGIAAAYTGFTHPDLFGNVLSQSGAYAWWPGYRDDPNPDRMLTSESGWLPRQFATHSNEANEANGARRALRFYLDAGTWENTATLLTNRQFRDLLQAMQHEVTYREYVGGHEHLLWRSTLSDGLVALLGTRAPPPARPGGR